MEMRFKKGDIVVLKSGGPNMTVKYTIHNSQKRQDVNCEWFSKSTGELCRYEFSADMLYPSNNVLKTVLEHLLKELVCNKQEVLNSPIRFEGVSVSTITQIFDELGVKYDPGF